MNLSIQVKITGSDRVRRKMTKLGSSLYNFKDAMNQIGRDGSRYFQGTAWQSQGGVYGNKWDALSANYASRKAKRYPGRGPLEKTGTMRRSFDHEATRSSVVIGNTTPYFEYHQSSAPRSKIPRRQMIGVSSGFKSIVRDIIQEDIKKKIRNA